MNEIESICPECDRTDDCACDAGINPVFYEQPKPTWAKPCERCGFSVARYRGQGDVVCGECGALYNAGGQRLRDDAPAFGVGGYWGPTPHDDDDY